MDNKSIVLVGDFMPGRLLNFDHPIPVIKDAEWNSENTEEKSQFIHEYFRKSIFRLCNLEGCFSPSPPDLEDLAGDPKGSISTHLIGLHRINSLLSYGVDCVSLANNHVLDGGKNAVQSTVHILNQHGIKWCGFGRNLSSAWKPRIITIDSKDLDMKGEENFELISGKENAIKLAIFSIADHLKEWRAQEDRFGINYFDIPNFSLEEGNPNWDIWVNFEHVRKEILKVKAKVDIIIFSIHWGNNFCWEPDESYIQFSHLLVDQGVQIVFGHSTHHIQGIEYYKGGLIIYGAGDFMNDYDLFEKVLNDAGESFGEDFKRFRSDLSFVYKIFIEKESSEMNEEGRRMGNGKSRLKKLELFPIRICNGHTLRANEEETQWLTAKVNELSSYLGGLTFRQEKEYLVSFLGTDTS